MTATAASRSLAAAVCVAVFVSLGPGTAAVQPLAPSPQSPAPPQRDPGTVGQLLSSAEALLQQQRGDRALPLLERALEEARGLGLESEQAQALAGIGEVLYYTTQYGAARERALGAIAIYERISDTAGIARTSHLLSMVEEMTGDIAAARTRATRAVEAYDSIGHRRGRALATLQFLRVGGRAIDELRPLYERLLIDARELGDRNLESRALHSYGDRLFVTARYEEALIRLNQAAGLMEQSGDLLALGTVFNSLGRVYRAHGRLDEALRFQLRALELHQKVGAPFQLLQSLNAVATVYERMGDPRSARTYYERALALAEQSSSQSVRDLVHANLGGLVLDLGEYARGAEALERVIANGVDAWPAIRYNHLSHAYAKLGRPRDALEAAGRAIDLCAQDEAVCVTALGRRAVAQAALGNTREALADVNAALAGIESMRGTLVPLDFFKQDFHRMQERIYSLAIALQIGEKQDRLALETAELARSRAFIDLLATRDVAFKERDRALLADLRDDGRGQPRPVGLAPDPPTSLALTLRGDGEPSAGRRTELTPASLELRSFVTAAPPAAGDLVATAARLHSTLVAYWVAEDDLFIWVVTPDGQVHARRVSVAQAKLVELIRSTAPFENGAGPAAPRNAIVMRGASTVTLQGRRPDAWRELYRLLIEPVRPLLPRAAGSLLTIVPQGPLLNVSFAALQNARGRYLLEDYTLHYAPAVAVLQFTRPKRRADARSGSMLVVADPTPPRLPNLDRPLARLPGARSEAAAISRLVPRDRVTVLQDAKATETSIRESAAGKAVLHFATHAIVSDEDPLQSFLALGPSGDATGDGLLTSEEVYGLDLSADLVVLSACRSAGGRITGDGISSFARAFIYAGTASLVASLWDVADEPTNRLLPQFYRGWLAGDSKSAALRSAQLALLRDLRAGRVRIDTPAGAVAIPEHPVFWAGFALFGEPD